jgi:alanine racemase
MSQPHPQEIPEIIESALIPFVSDLQFAEALSERAEAAKIRLPVHLKIDTGMGRIGCPAEEAVSLACRTASSPGLELAGVATHLAVSDSVKAADIEYTRTQLARFREAVDAIRTAGIAPGIIHAANSGAVILHEDAWFDMVRPGILLYGYKTVEENEAPPDHFKKLSGLKPLKAEPVMELKSSVVLIKKIKKGESVSYGRTWIAERDTNIAIIPAGYADGLPRLASGKWQAVIGGNVYPLAGRICMDQCSLDLGPETEVRRWDEAVIFGGPAPDAAALASIIGTIPYEITCNINKRVPRVYEK